MSVFAILRLLARRRTVRTVGNGMVERWMTGTVDDGKMDDGKMDSGTTATALRLLEQNKKDRTSEGNGVRKVVCNMVGRSEVVERNKVVERTTKVW